MSVFLKYPLSESPGLPSLYVVPGLRAHIQLFCPPSVKLHSHITITKELPVRSSIPSHMLFTFLPSPGNTCSFHLHWRRGFPESTVGMDLEVTTMKESWAELSKSHSTPSKKHSMEDTEAVHPQLQAPIQKRLSTTSFWLLREDAQSFSFSSSDSPCGACSLSTCFPYMGISEHWLPALWGFKNGRQKDCFPFLPTMPPVWIQIPCSDSLLLCPAGGR